MRADVDAADVRRLLVGAAHAWRAVAHDQDVVAGHLRLVLDALRPRRAGRMPSRSGSGR